MDEKHFWTLTDRIKEIGHKTEGPLLLVLGSVSAGYATSLFSNDELGSERYISAALYVCAVEFIRRGMGSIRFWHGIYKVVHDDIERLHNS